MGSLNLLSETTATDNRLQHHMKRHILYSNELSTDATSVVTTHVVDLTGVHDVMLTYKNSMFCPETIGTVF